MRNFPQNAQGQPRPTQRRSGLGVKVLTLDKGSLDNILTPLQLRSLSAPLLFPGSTDTQKQPHTHTHTHTHTPAQSYPQTKPKGERKALKEGKLQHPLPQGSHWESSPSQMCLQSQVLSAPAHLCWKFRPTHRHRLPVSKLT